MGCDLVVALDAATVAGRTIVGANHFGPGAAALELCVLSAKVHTPGENVSHPRVKIAEVRQTARVLGWQAPGSWGMSFGVNEHQLTVGLTTWKSRIAPPAEGLHGPDLVRLALERGTSARLGAEILCELIERHGQSAAQEDHVFMIADAHEAFVIEAAGTHWALLQCQSSRAISDVALIRQDWHRLSRGLSDFAIQQGWCQNDGAKINFQSSVADPNRSSPTGLKRWSRASLALAQQEGAIDHYCLRRLLLEHFDQCQDLMPRHQAWQGTHIVSLANDAPAIAWTSPAYLGVPLFFPLVPAAPIPGIWMEGLPMLNRPWMREESRHTAIQDRLQALFDQEAEDFLLKARALHDRPHEQVQLGQEMMARHMELYLHECSSPRPQKVTTSAQPDAMLAFVSE
ncbi:MAG: hypothetical protein WCL32_03170 [Planctomycetota bacterium]